MPYKKTFNNKLSILNKELIILENEFSVFKEVHENNKTRWRFYSFFRTIHDALEMDIIMIMSKIILPKRDTLNINQIIDYVDSHIKHLVGDDEDEIKKSKKQK